MVIHPNAHGSTYISVGNIAVGQTTTATICIGEYYPTFSFNNIMDNFEPAVFTEEKESNKGERVVCKGTSIRRELKALPNQTGYKARKEFWR